MTAHVFCCNHNLVVLKVQGFVYDALSGYSSKWILLQNVEVMAFCVDHQKTDGVP